jgi:rhodanese-related sulfurtransferase
MRLHYEPRFQVASLELAEIWTRVPLGVYDEGAAVTQIDHIGAVSQADVDDGYHPARHAPLLKWLFEHRPTIVKALFEYREGKHVTTIQERREAKDALFEGFATIARALGSGRRAEIVEVLAQGERTVEGVADTIGQTLANTSHHLRTLARAGLVATRRQGTHIYYRLASDRVGEAWLALRGLAADRLDMIEELTRAYVGDRDGVELITSDELRHRLDRHEVVLLDIRPEAEYGAGHLPGAISLPPDQLERVEQVLADLPVDRDIVVYCRGPFCVYADDAIRHLATRGRHALRLEDGVPEWRQAGGPIEP